MTGSSSNNAVVGTRSQFLKVPLLLLLAAAVVASLVIWIASSSSHPTSSPKPNRHVVLPALPDGSLPGASNLDTVKMKTIVGNGSRSLPAFALSNSTVHVQFACTGRGRFEVVGYFTLESCTGPGNASSATYHHQPKRLVNTAVIAPRTLHWEIYISSGP